MKYIMIKKKEFILFYLVYKLIHKNIHRIFHLVLVWMDLI